METSFKEAQAAFEEWICSMASEDEILESTQLVYGLVTVGIFLIGYHDYEQHRSDLMGIYGLDWFALNGKAWRENKLLIYNNPNELLRHAV